MLSKLLFSFVIVSFVFGCGERTDSVIEGNLFLSGGGQVVRSLSFPDGKVEILYKDLDANIDNIQRFRDNELIFNVFKGPLSTGDMIVFNKKTGDRKKIEKGQLLLWLEQESKLIYYDKNGNLCVAVLRNNSIAEKKEIVPSSEVPINRPPVVGVSRDEIIFERKKEGVTNIWKFNLSKGTFRIMNGLNGCSLSHNIGMIKEDKLFCIDRTGGFCRQKPVGKQPRKKLSSEYCVASLDGTEKEPVVFDDEKPNNFSPVFYLKENDSIVLNRVYFSWIPFGERNDVWIYNLQTGKKRRILDKGGYLGKTSAWYPK